MVDQLPNEPVRDPVVRQVMYLRQLAVGPDRLPHPIQNVVLDPIIRLACQHQLPLLAALPVLYLFLNDFVKGHRRIEIQVLQYFV
ncbi:hypothetical protein D3C74_412940 [compost metagenome]